MVIDREEKTNIVDKRVKAIISSFTKSFYIYVIRSLLSKDKLIFSFTILLKILSKEKKIITPEEIRFFMMGG